jgi:hypothetical protein
MAPSVVVSGKVVELVICLCPCALAAVQILTKRGVIQLLDPSG